MKFTILSAKNYATTLKVTIQKSGRLGFTDDSAKALRLSTEKYAKFAQDDENGSLYLIILDKNDEDAFEIKISSGYYYVSTKVLFDSLGFMYEDGNIMFDLIRRSSLDDQFSGQVYFMKQRLTKNKERKNDISEP